MTSTSQTLGKASDNDCSESCAGDSATACGRDGNKVSVYGYNPGVRIKCSPTDFSKFVPCSVISYGREGYSDTLNFKFGNGRSSDITLGGKRLCFYSKSSCIVLFLI